MDKLKYIVKEVVSFLIMLGIMFIIVKVVYANILEPFMVDGRSMEYTLHDGERMFMFKRADIERFDVIVFPNPRDLDRQETVAATDPELADDMDVALYVKRIIGVPGDSIAYQDGQLIINDQVVEEPYLKEMASQVQGNFTNDFDMETITGEALVPEGKYFVLGDNRRNSVDGRSFGFIDADTVVGEANAVYWPLSNMRLLDQYVLSEDGSAIVIE